MIPAFGEVGPYASHPATHVKDFNRATDIENPFPNLGDVSAGLGCGQLVAVNLPVPLRGDIDQAATLTDDIGYVMPPSPLVPEGDGFF